MKTPKHTQIQLGPLVKRICHCGCLTEFMPTREDNIYVNKQHANYGYNNGPRKKKNAEKTRQVKILDRNDRVLEKYFQANVRADNTATVYFDILRADGYDFSTHVGTIEQEGKEYYLTFRYVILVIPSDPKRVKIKKR